MSIEKKSSSYARIATITAIITSICTVMATTITLKNHFLNSIQPDIRVYWYREDENALINLTILNKTTNPLNVCRMGYFFSDEERDLNKATLGYDPDIFLSGSNSTIAPRDSITYALWPLSEINASFQKSGKKYIGFFIEDKVETIWQTPLYSSLDEFPDH